jgi:hypothetical protein
VARPRKVITLEERRELLLRRTELATLTRLPNWQVFGAVIQEEIDRIQKTVLARALGVGISLEQQAFERGRIIGLRAARSIPEHALHKELTESSPTEREVAAGE